MTLFTVIFFYPHEITDYPFTRDDQTPESNDSFPGWDVHSIYGYMPENPVVNAQKLDDTEDTPWKKISGDYGARCTLAAFHVVLPSLTRTYRWSYLTV